MSGDSQKEQERDTRRVEAVTEDGHFLKLKYISHITLRKFKVYAAYCFDIFICCNKLPL